MESTKEKPSENIIAGDRLRFHSETGTLLSYARKFKEEQAGYDEKPKEPTPEEQIQELHRELERREAYWKKRAEQMQQEAAEKGYEEGWRAGEQQARKHISAIKNSIEEADRSLRKQIRTIQPSLLNMVFKLVEKILQVPLDDDGLRNQVANEIERQLDAIDDELRVSIYVAREDYDAVEDRLQDETEMRFKLRPDVELKPGEYRIDTAKQRIERDYERLLEDFESTLKEAADTSGNQDTVEHFE